MNQRKRTDCRGFTLVEMLIVIVAASIVTFAVMTVVLLGLNTNQRVSENATAQTNARMVTQVLQSLTERSINGVEQVGGDYTILGHDSSQPDAEDTALMLYSQSSGTLENAAGQVLLEGVESFEASLGADGKLLTFTLSIDGRNYTRSTYCRTKTFEMPEVESTTSTTEIRTTIEAASNELKEKEKEEAPEENALAKTAESRLRFLTLLATQYGSTGTIQDVSGSGTGLTYAQWYNRNWSEDTPWCACFVSWAANLAKGLSLIQGEAPRFANVTKGVALFKSYGTWHERNEEGYSPAPGDYVFFDFSDDPGEDHVGVVLTVREQNGVPCIITIEGNSSGSVALRAYALNNAKIKGYGVLNWTETSTGQGA